MRCTVLMAALCAVMGFSSDLLAAGAADEVRVTGAYVRAVPPGQPNSAAFMSLSNGGAKPHALVGAQSPVAETLELHTHLMEGEMMRMRRVDRFEIPAGGSVALDPGGNHLMLIGLKRFLKPDQEIELTLRFEDQSIQKLQAPVRTLEATLMQHDHAKH